MPKRADLTGMKFGELTVIGYAGGHRQPSGQMRAVWHVQCSCGVVKKCSTGTIKHSGTVSCGHVGIAKRAEIRRRPAGEAAKNSLYLSYRASARIRGHEFDLTKDQFFAVAVGQCAYCGNENGQTHKGKFSTGFEYCGVDRMDNAAGYVPENIVTCCGICNRMKSTLSRGEFIQHIQRICRHAT